MFWKTFQFSLFQCMLCPSIISISSVFCLGKATFPFSRENQWFCLFTHKQTFAAGVRHTCTNPTSGAQRPVADDFAQQLDWCDAERTTAKNPRCAGIKENSYLFSFVKADVLFWMCFSFVYLEENVRIPYYVPSSFRHPLPIVKVDVSEISNRLPDYPTLKNNSHETRKCSVTRKKYFERPHTAVFRRQRLGTTPRTMTGR